MKNMMISYESAINSSVEDKVRKYHQAQYDLYFRTLSLYDRKIIS